MYVVDAPVSKFTKCCFASSNCRITSWALFSCLHYFTYDFKALSTRPLWLTWALCSREKKKKACKGRSTTYGERTSVLKKVGVFLAPATLYAETRLWWKWKPRQFPQLKITCGEFSNHGYPPCLMIPLCSELRSKGCLLCLLKPAWDVFENQGYSPSLLIPLCDPNQIWLKFATFSVPCTWWN